jgi:hypothetical protein
MNKRNHANWVYEQEAKGVLIHKKIFQFGPKHPESYLLYNDSGTLVFPRDHRGFYSSYAFWLNHLCDKEPIEYLGSLYFSSRELGISPDLIEELYVLQNEFIEYEFRPSLTEDNITYTADNGIIYDNFKTFSIKIVMTSLDPSVIPRVKDLRIIALPAG